MKVRTICACVSTALLFSFSTSTVFADVTQVFDRGSLTSSDTIYWDEQGTQVCPVDPEDLIACPISEFYGYLIGSIDVSNVTATNGTELAVSHLIDPDFEVIRDLPDYYYFRDVNFEDGDYLLSTYGFTNGANSQQNPSTFVFSDTNDESICGFVTQIAPYDLGEFTAELQAFAIVDGSPAAIGDPVIIGDPDNIVSDTDDSAAFIGLRSTTPLTSVAIVITSTGGGAGDLASWYAVNDVTLTYCSDLEPQIPVLTCEGFAAPMVIHPVKAKKNRVFPLKMELFDNGIEQTDVELVAAPVVQVSYSSSSSIDDAVDVTGDALTAGQGSDGNQFDYTDDGIWQFNLKSKNHKASGTYYVTVVSGDDTEYMIDTNCETSFSIK